MKEKTPEALAKSFSDILREWLTAEEMTEVVKRNKMAEYYDVGACASHDFCDANQAMIDAFVKIFNREVGLEWTSDLTMVNKAWKIAKENEFFLTDRINTVNYTDGSIPYPGKLYISRQYKYIRAESVHGWNIAKIEEQHGYTQATAHKLVLAYNSYDKLVMHLSRLINATGNNLSSLIPEAKEFLNTIIPKQ